MKEKIKKILRDMELCNGFYDFIIGPDESRLLVNYIKQLKQENKQLKSILTDLEEWCNDGIKDELVKIDYGTEIIGKPIKIHIASYEMILDKIQVLKEKYK